MTATKGAIVDDWKLVLRWMRAEVADGGFREPQTDEPCYTQLAEAAADRFDSYEWLDEETSEVWDLAIRAFE